MPWGRPKLNILIYHTPTGCLLTGEAASVLVSFWSTLPLTLGQATKGTSITQMIALLERYTQHLSSFHVSTANSGDTGQKASDDIYDMPADIQLPEELGEFANVYQVHCPKINLNNATRDVIQFVSFRFFLLKHRADTTTILSCIEGAPWCVLVLAN